MLHALFLAGGMAPGADPKKAFLVRGSTRTPVDMDRLIQEGDLSQNLTLEAGRYADHSRGARDPEVPFS